MKRRQFCSLLVTAATAGAAVSLCRTSAGFGRSAQPLTGNDEAAASVRQRAFALTDSNGKPVTDYSFRGGWLIVFFGFSHCADVCPAALFKLSRALEALGDEGKHVRVAFITVDPERDSPEVLRNYLRPFGAQFTGLTGTQQQINTAQQTFRAYAEKKAPAADGSYAMNHSSALYVVDPNGQFRRQISADTDIKDLAATLRNAMNLQRPDRAS